jgi:protocatechuate 3,4-dioxygenase beta subunit
MFLRPVRFLLGIALVAVTSIPAHAAEIVVEGVVRSAEGNSPPGARVELRPVVSPYAAGLAELEELRSGEPPPVAKAGTDRMGRFRLRVPEAGLWRLVAAADGFVPMEIAALPILEEISLPAVTLRSDAGLRVRVVDPDGNPVPGAQVLGKTGKPALWGVSDWQPVRRVAMTGPEGTLRLARAAIEPLLLWAERPGFPAQGEILAEGREAVLRLQPGVARFLVALDAEGHPLPGALFRDPRSSLALGRFDGQHPLVLAAPATGLWDLRVELADGQTMSFRTTETQRPVGASPIPLRVSMAVPLTGRILDGADGAGAAGHRPLAGALVWTGGNSGGVTRTDAAGIYRLAAQVPGSRVDLRAAAAGHRPGQLKVALPSRSSENPRRAPDLPLVPAPVPAIAGVVVDEAARPLANAEIRLVRPELDRRWSAEEPRLARSSADGSFRIAPLQAGGLYLLTVSRPGFAPRTLAVPVTLPPRSRSPIRVALSRGRTVSGRVLDPRQRPIPGATVKLADGRPNSSFETEPQLGPFRAETDAGGRFQVPGLPAGLFELRIEGSELAPLRARLISVPQGEGPVDLGTFTLEGRTRISGWIVDPGGRPVEGAEIWVVPEESNSITLAERQAGPAVVTGRDGHFELRDRSLGDREKLRVCRKGFLPAEFQAQDPAAGEPQVALTPSTRIAGRVMNAGGEPLTGMTVSASLSSETGIDFVVPEPSCPFDDTAITNAEGRFVLELKSPGHYDVTASGAGYLLGEQDHLVPPEGLDGIELRLEGGTVVSGHVSDPEGRAVAGVSIVLSGARSYSQAHSDSRGDYLLEGVDPGDNMLEWEHPDFEAASQKVEIPDTPYRLNFTLPNPKSRLEARGRVTDLDGVPIEGAIVDGSATRTATLADGSFAVRVDKGSVTLFAEKEGFAVATLDVKVENRSLDGLEIRLGHGLTLRGRVLGVNPAAVLESSISVTTYYGREILTPLDFAGRFEVHDLPSGEWILLAQAGDREAWGHVTPLPGQTEVVHDLEFASLSEVWGVITGPGGERIAGASLVLTRGDGMSFQAQVRADGSFTLEVPDGTYALSASADGYVGRDADQPVVVAGAPVRNVELQLETNVVLTGRLLGLARGDTLKAFQVDGPPAFHPGAWSVDHEAHYRQPGLGPGDWKVYATFQLGDRERHASGKIHIPSGATEATLDLDFHIDPNAP